MKAARRHLPSLPATLPAPDPSVPTANTNQLSRQLVNGKIEAVGEKEKANVLD